MTHFIVIEDGELSEEYPVNTDEERRLARGAMFGSGVEKTPVYVRETPESAPEGAGFSFWIYGYVCDHGVSLDDHCEECSSYMSTVLVDLFRVSP